MQVILTLFPETAYCLNRDCSRGSACQLLHRICIIQQPRGRGERGAGEGTRHGEELAYKKREHSLEVNKLTESDWLRGL